MEPQLPTLGDLQLYNGDDDEGLFLEYVDGDTNFDYFNHGAVPFEEYQEVLEYKFKIEKIKEDDTMEKAQLLYQKGDVSDCIEVLESVVKRDPKNDQAWALLGTCHAECDSDTIAIYCLKHSIELNYSNQLPRIQLCVSLTNELQNSQPLRYLIEWMQLSKYNNDVDYKGLLSGESPTIENVIELFKSVLIKPTLIEDQDQDQNNNVVVEDQADIHIILGILYNMSYELDKGADHFGISLKTRQTDYRLWNKLGATLFNSGTRNEEAIVAFMHALDENPRYVRARSNIALVYTVLGQHDQAIHACLNALAIHSSSPLIWRQLELLFRTTNRLDLVSKCQTQNINLFVDEFNLVLPESKL